MTINSFCRYICCGHKRKTYWGDDKQLSLEHYILAGCNVREISNIMEETPDFIKSKIVDTMAEYPNYLETYNNGPGVDYCNYINFIKAQYEYQSL